MALVFFTPHALPITRKKTLSNNVLLTWVRKWIQNWELWGSIQPLIKF